ncbi:MAG: Rrf2 family transcriptional regulator [Thermoleophilia bacterium]
MRISAKADYGLRAMAALALLQAEREGPVTREQIAEAQEIPLAFLENILLDLKRAGLVMSIRGQRGGFRLLRPAEAITLAQVIRALEGPLASVRGQRPEDLAFQGPAAPLRDVWVAVRANLRAVLERVTIADLVGGSLPEEVSALTRVPDAWHGR